MPRDQSFDKTTEDHWNVEVLTCHACAARERKAWNRNAGREEGAPPDFGKFFAVVGLDDEYGGR